MGGGEETRQPAGGPPPTGPAAGATGRTAAAVVAERIRQYFKRHAMLMKATEGAIRFLDASPLASAFEPLKTRLVRKTTLPELVLVLDALAAEAIPFWLAGGWGIDALVGRVTRHHKDIDLVIADFAHTEPRARRALVGLGFRHVDMDQGGIWMPARSNFEDSAGHRVELLEIDWAEVGRALPNAPRTGSPEDLAPAVLTIGAIDSRPMPCLTATAQLLFHTGFYLDAVARHDVSLLRAEMAIDA